MPSERPMHVVVDFTKCDSNGLCAAEAPQIYELDDNDELLVLQDVVAGADLEASERAAMMCPKQAISHRLAE